MCRGAGITLDAALLGGAIPACAGEPSSPTASRSPPRGSTDQVVAWPSTPFRPSDSELANQPTRISTPAPSLTSTNSTPHTFSQALTTSRNHPLTSSCAVATKSSERKSVPSGGGVPDSTNEYVNGRISGHCSGLSRYGSRTAPAESPCPSVPGSLVIGYSLSGVRVRRAPSTRRPLPGHCDRAGLQPSADQIRLSASISLNVVLARYRSPPPSRAT